MKHDLKAYFNNVLKNNNVKILNIKCLKTLKISFH